MLGQECQNFGTPSTGAEFCDCDEAQHLVACLDLSRFPGESAAMGKRCIHVFRVPEASPRSGFTKEFHVGGGVDVGLLVGGEKITVPTRGPNSIKRLALVFCSQNTPEDVAPSHNIPHSGRALLGGLLEGQ